MLVQLSPAIAAICILSSAALAQAASTPSDPQIAHIAYTAENLPFSPCRDVANLYGMCSYIQETWLASDTAPVICRGFLFDILILNGVVPMTNRIDILKIVAVAAAIGIVFYFLAHRGV